jgi:hypothetical protein
MRWIAYLVSSLILIGMLLPVPTGKAAVTQDEVNAASPQAVNLELILDVSGSMAQVIETGETRMEAAKRVLREVIGSIPDREGINVGLRIYGHRGDNTEAGQAESCQSSELVVPISGVDKQEVLEAIEGLQPTGWTPLALSLERAGEDFEPAENAENAVILVTDGLETCGGDPCAVAGQLQSADIQMVTHVVGFALAPEEQATLGCIAEQGGGLLLGAVNATELTAALFTVLEELEVVQGVGFIGGNALPVMPEGESGELSVVAVGLYDGNQLPIVVRNNTGEDVIRITAVVSAKNQSGQLIATGGDQLFSPNLVRSGGVSFGYAYFGGVDLPPDTQFEFDLDARSATDDRYENRRDLEVVEASSLEGRVVGTLQNTYDTLLTGPISVVAVCFDESGTLLGHERGFSNKDQLAPDETLAVQVGRPGTGPCLLFLLAGSGWDNSFSRNNDVEPPSDEEAPTVAARDRGEDEEAEEGDESPAATEPSESRDSADASGCPDLTSPEDVVLALQNQGMPIADYEVYTAETDPNELLGRPAQYIGKLNFRDSRLAPNFTDFNVSDGGSIEVFDRESRAQARHDYIAALGEASSLFAEYLYLEGTVLLRLSSRLTPDQAMAYEEAFQEVVACTDVG